MNRNIRKYLVVTGLLLGISFGQPGSLQAQSGCPARPNASILLEEETLEVYPLITALPEIQPPLVQGTFIEQVFELTYSLGQQVWLTSYIDGGD